LGASAPKMSGVFTPIVSPDQRQTAAGKDPGHPDRAALETGSGNA
jgi:hypothetical protein